MTSGAVCRWCAAAAGESVLDLGLQPACDEFPRPGDPPPRLHPLRLWVCARCRLAQLPDRSPPPEEPRAIEPAALARHARESVAWARSHGLLRPGAAVREFGSPHGGSWRVPLSEVGLSVLAGRVSNRADVVLDVFGLMHEEDQRAGMQRRVDQLDEAGLLILVFPPLETLVRRGQWNAIRHGHHAYPSTAVAARQLEELGLTVVATTLHPLYGGTRLLAAHRGGNASPVDLPADVPEPALLAMASGVAHTVSALRGHLQRAAVSGRRVLGYGAASRAVPLLVAAEVGPALLPGIADASPDKQGRLLPGVGVPVISPADLVAAQPDEVLLFLPDLLEEVRSSLPEVQQRGGTWWSMESLLSQGTAG